MTTAFSTWTFLSNHGHVFLVVARRPNARVADIAAAVGLSVRSVLTILADLEREGYVERRHEGRRTAYTVHPEKHFRHPSLVDHEVGELLDVFDVPGRSEGGRGAAVRWSGQGV